MRLQERPERRLLAVALTAAGLAACQLEGDPLEPGVRESSLATPALDTTPARPVPQPVSRSSDQRFTLVEESAAGPEAHPRIWLEPAMLAKLNARQNANAPEWQALLQWCEANVGDVTDGSGVRFDAGNVAWNGYRMGGYALHLMNFSLAYQILKDDDPVRAARYADWVRDLLIDGVVVGMSVGEEENGLKALRCGETDDRTINAAEGAARGIGSASYKLGYPSRFLAAVPIAYDWIHETLSASERTRLAAVMFGWYDWIRGERTSFNDGVLWQGVRYFEDRDGPCAGSDNCTSVTGAGTRGYTYLTDPSHNFYGGHLTLMPLIPIATRGDHAEASTYEADIRSVLIDNFLAAVHSDTRFSGGDSVEGWNYGSSWFRVLEALLAWRTGTGEDLLSTSPWPSALLRANLHRLAPDLLHVPQYGDWTGTPIGENREYFLLSVAGIHQLLFPDALESKVGQWVLKNVNTGGGAEAWRSMLWYEPSFPVQPVSGLPRFYHSRGSGFVSMRSGWEADALMAYVRLEGKLSTDHEGADEGDLQLFRGSDHLITHKVARGEAVDASTVVFNQTNHLSSNPPMAQPAVDRIEDVAAFFYVSGDISNAYRRQFRDDRAKLFRRSIVLVRPRFLVVYDVTQSNPDLGLRKDWYLQLKGQPTIAGNDIAATVGQSRLFSHTLFPTGGAYTVDNPANGSFWTIWRVGYRPADAEFTQFLHVLEAAPASASATPVAAIAGTGVRGARIGTGGQQSIVMFTSSQTGALVENASYSVTAASPSRHIIADVSPGASYTVTISGTATTVSASPAGSLTFTTTLTGALDISLARQ